MFWFLNDTFAKERKNLRIDEFRFFLGPCRLKWWVKLYRSLYKLSVLFPDSIQDFQVRGKFSPWSDMAGNLTGLKLFSLKLVLLHKDCESCDIIADLHFW